MELVDTSSVSQQWIVCLAISSWTVVEPGKCGSEFNFFGIDADLHIGDAYIAYATDDGVVGVLKVRQTLDNVPAASPFGLNFSVRLTIETPTVPLCAADHRPCSALEWMEVPGGVSFPHFNPAPNDSEAALVS